MSKTDPCIGQTDLGRLFEELYERIRKLAARVRWDKGNPTLNATALCHEAYLKLLKDPPDLNNRSYEEVIAVFANAMRQILIDASRRKAAAKRQVIERTKDTPLSREDQVTLAALLENLRKEDPRQARIVDCRFYLGMTLGETAAALGISTATVERESRAAKARLSRGAEGSDA